TACDLLAFMSSPEMNAQTRGFGQCFADISGYVDTKLQAISAHKSQLPKLDVESSRDLARAMGRISGFQYAEAYDVLRVLIWTCGPAAARRALDWRGRRGLAPVAAARTDQVQPGTNLVGAGRLGAQALAGELERDHVLGLGGQLARLGDHAALLGSP